MTRFTRLAVASLALLTLGTPPEAAAPITYDESVSGDLPSPFETTPAPILPFDIGVNTVAGTQGFLEFLDSDFVVFSIPSGTMLVAATFTLTDAVGDLINVLMRFDRGINPFPAAGDLLAFFGVFSPGTRALAAVPQGPGIYSLVPGLTGNGLSAYIFTFEVRADTQAPIPEPASMTLLGLGSPASVRVAGGGTHASPH